MCSPIAFAIGAQVASGAMNAYSANQEGKANEATLAMQRDLELTKARDVRNRGSVEAGQVRTEGSRAVSSARTALTAGNIDTSVGSAADALGEIRATSELDALTVRSNAAREAWGHEAQASILEQERKNAKRQRGMAVLGSFLGSAAGIGKSMGAK